jgi:carbon monoxide dehydrogenase subunit G
VKIEGTHKLAASRTVIFDLLTNPLLLQKCIPGCEQMDKVGDNRYDARLSIGIGPIKGRFTATVSLQELRRPEHYALVMEGKGQPGFVKGSGQLNFVDDEGATIVNFTGEVHVGGLLASVGQRMIQAAGKMMAERFFVALEKTAKEESGAEPEEKEQVAKLQEATLEATLEDAPKEEAS